MEFAATGNVADDADLYVAKNYFFESPGYMDNGGNGDTGHV